jgi:hypothetical protein
MSEATTDPTLIKLNHALTSLVLHQVEFDAAVEIVGPGGPVPFLDLFPGPQCGV